MENVFTKKDPLLDVINQVVLGEKKLTDAELKKREEIAQAMERDNPGMDMGKKMAIATAQAKKVAEEVELDESKLSVGDKLMWAHSKSVGTGGPKELVKRHKGYDTDTLKKMKNGSSDGNSPAALQQRVINHELKKRGVAEEVELNLDEQLENFWGAYLTCLDEAKDDASQQALLLRAMAKDPSDLMKMKRAISMGDKALTNPVMRQEILKMLDQMMNLTVTDKALLQKTRSSFMKQKQFKAADTTNTEEYVPEEVKELDEAKIPVHHVNQAVTKVLGTDGAARFATHLRPGTDKHTSWDKVNNALMKQGVKTKHIASVAAHLKPAQYNEEAEQIDEISKKTLGSYIKKASGDANDNAVRASWETSRIAVGDPNDPGNHGKANKYIRDLRNRKKGISRATDKLTKEEAEQVDEAGGFIMDKGMGRSAGPAPFEGGREVKSSKPAAERVKKIAKGMLKKYTKKD